MIRIRRSLLLLIALLPAILVGTAPAHASTDVESMMQDDDLLMYSPAATVAKTLDTMKSLGVDRVRLTIKWQAIAPKPDSFTKPNFDAADPASYPNSAWAPYDTIVKLAQARGIGVNFNVTAPAPFWATAEGAPSEKNQGVWYPSPQEFGLFVTALGLRYSGGYRPPITPPGSKPAPGLGGVLGGRTPVPGTFDPPLPRVSYWSIWNEPNQPGWLLPQGVRSGKSLIDFAAVRYRALVDAAGTALAVTGHGPDTILLGETAPSGLKRLGTLSATLPLVFLRDLYCVNRRLRPLKGSKAKSLSCPAKADARAFAAAHPSLFNVTGIAHHPYSFFFPPTTRSPLTDSVALSDLGRLTHTMNGIFRRAGHAHAGGVPLYLTEYGYQTNPPDPNQVVSLANQAAYLNQADYLAYRDPRVKVLSQFLLDDDPPNSKVPKGSSFYWGTFQTGLRLSNHKPKPAYSAWRLPIYVVRKRAHRRLTVWGMVRPAANGAHFDAKLVFRPSSGGHVRTLRTIHVHSARGTFTIGVTVPSRGTLRLSWEGLLSRAVSVR